MSDNDNMSELSEDEIAGVSGGTDWGAPPNSWEAEAFSMHIGHEVGVPCPHCGAVAEGRYSLYGSLAFLPAGVIYQNVMCMACRVRLPDMPKTN